MSEEIKEKNEIREAGSNEAETPAAPDRAEVRMEWRDTLGLQLSDVEDYMVNAGENGESAGSSDDHKDIPADPVGTVSHEAAAAAGEVPAPAVSAESTISADEKSGGKNNKEKKGKGGFVKNLLSFIVGFGCCLAVLFAASEFGLLGNFISGSDLGGLDESYSKFHEILKMIEDDPIADKDPKTINDEELKEIVSSIGDPYAEYYTAAEYEDMLKRFDEEYVGIGIGVTEENGDIVIKTVFEDTPAEEAGIQVDDVITGVDGEKPESVDDAVSKITGKAGTEVTVTVRRGDETIDFTVKRANIETDSVIHGSLKENPEIGYIHMTMFKRGTDKEFKDAVKSLKEEGCDKFILDLRDNGGGLTDVCIEIADYLLPSCKIMTENSKNGDETIYNSKSESADLDLIVLVNENTASASEILTAALQDNGACTVIGKQTYGKGVIQIMHRFSDGSGIKITTTEYFRPNGDPVNEVGITPDIDPGDEDALDAAIREFEQ